MSERTVGLYIDDIRRAIDNIQTYTKELSYESFSQDAKTIDAVVRNIEIIGEAIQQLPEELHIQYPSVPWKQIVGARNKVIHEYFGVDEKIVWKTVQEDIPVLKQQILTIVQDLQK